jgi:hypothetical protein|tara:strand:+ start:2402 stop:2761 length:360 start_codon:yes stop_codon:yes gene_type:complete
MFALEDRKGEGHTYTFDAAESRPVVQHVDHVAQPKRTLVDGWSAQTHLFHDATLPVNRVGIPEYGRHGSHELRFFASNGFDKDLIAAPDAIARAYDQGVAMSADLGRQDNGSPEFFVWA